MAPHQPPGVDVEFAAHLLGSPPAPWFTMSLSGHPRPRGVPRVAVGSDRNAWPTSVHAHIPQQGEGHRGRGWLGDDVVRLSLLSQRARQWRMCSRCCGNVAAGSTPGGCHRRGRSHLLLTWQNSALAEVAADVDVMGNRCRQVA